VTTRAAALPGQLRSLGSCAAPLDMKPRPGALLSSDELGRE
jgi:hypothetical protein